MAFLISRFYHIPKLQGLVVTTVRWYFYEQFSVLSYYFFLKVERSYFKLIACSL